MMILNYLNFCRKVLFDENFMILNENGYDYIKKDMTSMIKLNGEMIRVK
jgi:hypothetical protein